MKIIIGLGNPGRKYSDTRHNMGFKVIEEFARRHTIDKEEYKYDSIIGHSRFGSEKVLLVKPLTFMNLSGRAVQPLVNFYKIDLSEIFVAYDDMDLEEGRIRVRASGGSGGHKGIQSIIDLLGNRDFPRIRIGIGRPPQGVAVERWVLSAVDPIQAKTYNECFELAADAVECWIQHGIVTVMNQYNR